MAEGKNLVGVDIGSSSIKVCQLKEGRKGYGLVRLGFTPLPLLGIPGWWPENGELSFYDDAQVFRPRRTPSLPATPACGLHHP